MNGCRKGFTLVELLVVIVIIGVLAGLAVPAVNNSLRRARFVESQSNLRQIGVALQLFAQDHEGILPVARGTLTYQSDWESVPEAQRSWQMQLIPYTSGSEKIFQSAYAGSYNPTAKRWGFFLGGHAAREEAKAEGLTGDASFRGLNLRKMQTPSKHIIAGECFFGMTANDSDKDDYNSNNPAFKNKDPRVKTNVLFADGHIESIGRPDPEQLAVLYTGPDAADPSGYFVGSP